MRSAVACAILGARTVLGGGAFLGACGHGASVEAPARAAWAPEHAWIRSAKLDPDVQEFLVRSVDEDHAFPFVVTLDAAMDADLSRRLASAGIGLAEAERTPRPAVTVVVRARPADLRVLEAEPHVRLVQCRGDGDARDPVAGTNGETKEASVGATTSAGTATGDAWRGKVDADVRTIVGAKSTCFVALAIRFSRDVDLAARATLEAASADVFAFDAKSAIVWLPIRAVPRVARLDFVGKIERRQDDPRDGR